MQNIRLQYTSWKEMPSEIHAFFVRLVDGRAEVGQTFYELYFYWYNVAHELGHILRGQYGKDSNSHWTEETVVNQFAVAYWREQGEAERLALLRRLVSDAYSRLEDPTPRGESRAAYFDANYSELTTNPNAYAFYQFGMVLSALDDRLDFFQALLTFIMPQAREAPPRFATPYTNIHPDLPPRIVNDMRENLALYGIDLPEIHVVRAFSPMVQFVDWD